MNSNFFFGQLKYLSIFELISRIEKFQNRNTFVQQSAVCVVTLSCFQRGFLVFAQIPFTVQLQHFPVTRADLKLANLANFFT